MQQINYNQHFVDKSDLASIIKTSKSKNLTQGKKVKKFEENLCNFTGAKHCITTNSASTALYLGIKTILIREKNINNFCFISPNTYAATANCALLNGLQVKFIDIDKSLNMSPANLERELKKRKKNKKKTIVILTHFAGNPSEMQQFKKLAKKYNLLIVEDASHALGSKYKNTKIGNPKFSYFVITSFHPVKTITTAEGGAIFTNSSKNYHLLNDLRSNGVIKKEFFQKNYNDQIYPSLNFRLSDLHASLGISQLVKIRKFINFRNKVSQLYKKKINNSQISFQKITQNSTSSFHLFIVRFKNISFNQKIKFMKKFSKKGINFHNLYIPLNYFKIYSSYKYKCSEAEKFYKDSICVPIFFNMKIKLINRIIKILNEFTKF